MTATAATYPYTYRHIGVGGCGGVAWRGKTRLRPGDYLLVEQALFPDGTRPRTGSAVRCGSCGGPLSCAPRIERTEGGDSVDKEPA